MLKSFDQRNHVAILLMVATAIAAAALGGASIRQPIYTSGAVIAFLTIVAVFMPRVDRLVGYMAVFCIGFMALAPLHLVPSAIRFGQLLVFFLIATVVLLRRARPAAHWRLIGLFAVYLVVTLASTLIDSLSGALFQYVVHAVVGLTFLTLGVLASPAERTMIIRFIIGLAAVQAVYAVVETITLPPVLWASPVPSTFATPYSRLSSEIIPGLLRAQGTFGHPLLLSMFLAVAMALTARHEFTNPRNRVALAVLFLAGALATGSRSTLLIMIVLVLFAFGRQQMSMLRGVLLALSIGVVAYFGGFFGSTVVDRFSESGSVSHRAGAIDAVPRLLSQPIEQVLIGNGWYSREYLFDRGFLQLDGFLAVDNQFVSLLVTAGLLGVALFVAIIATSVWLAPAGLRPALFAAFAMYIVFDVNEFPAPWAMLALLLGLVAHRLPSEIPATRAREGWSRGSRERQIQATAEQASLALA